MAHLSRWPELMPEADGDLVRRALKGQHGAFGVLYERYADRVFGYVRFRVRNEETAWDLTQDAFEHALRGLPDLQDGDSFGGWLMTIAHNSVANHWRGATRHPSSQELDVDEATADSALRRYDPDLAADVERRVRIEEVRVAAVALTDLQQDVLALRFSAGLSLGETAGVLDRSEAAVKQVQYRALTELRRTVRDREDKP